MQATAKLKFVRMSPQKARLVADQVRGMKVDAAFNVLAFNNKRAAQLLKKVLESAVANAEHNEGADIDELRVSEVLVDEGPRHKRLSARARGRANRIIKRTSHITMTVADR